jgi:hypothetical protein
VEAIHGTDLDTVGQFAFDAGFGDNERHWCVFQAVLSVLERVSYAKEGIISSGTTPHHAPSREYAKLRVTQSAPLCHLTTTPLSL